MSEFIAESPEFLVATQERNFADASDGMDFVFSHAFEC